MRIFEVKNETGEIAQRWAELLLITSDGIFRPPLGELIVSQRMVKGVSVQDGAITFRSTWDTDWETFVREACEAQDKLTSLMDEALHIKFLLGIWKELER